MTLPEDPDLCQRLFDALVLFRRVIYGLPPTERSFTANEAQGAGKQKRVAGIEGGDSSANP